MRNKLLYKVKTRVKPETKMDLRRFLLVRSPLPGAHRRSYLRQRIGMMLRDSTGPHVLKLFYSERLLIVPATRPNVGRMLTNNKCGITSLELKATLTGGCRCAGQPACCPDPIPHCAWRNDSPLLPLTFSPNAVEVLRQCMKNSVFPDHTHLKWHGLDQGPSDFSVGISMRLPNAFPPAHRPMDSSSAIPSLCVFLDSAHLPAPLPLYIGQRTLKDECPLYVFFTQFGCSRAGWGAPQ